MLNRKEYETNKNLCIILDGSLKIIYFNKFDESKVENIVKDLQIQNCIKEKNTIYKRLNKCIFKINRCMVNNKHILIIESEFDFAWDLRNNINRDNLTGLYNQKFWLNIVNSKPSYFNFNDYSIIQVINIDDYNKTGYSYDKLNREKCIREISYIIKNNINKDDLAFRYKENEFIIISTGDCTDKIKEDISHIEIECNVSIGSCELNNEFITEQALAIANKNMYIQKSRENKIKHNNIKSEIERLKDKLNFLMKNNYKNNYEQVLAVSMQLDNVINEYCMLEKNK